MNSEYKDLSYDSKRFLEVLMANIIIAGGRRIEPDKLSEMTIGEVLSMCGPNGVVISSKFIGHADLK